MDLFVPEFPMRIDLVYADAAHPENIFKTALYKPDAKLWLHRDLASVVFLAAKRCQQRHKWRLVLKDGLRTVEAQAAMLETPVSKANLHWFAEETRMLTTPGLGGHPRAMAVDLAPEDEATGMAIDMGTLFDAMPTADNPIYNPAARDFTDLPEDVLNNRKKLERAMTDAAKELDLPIFLLPSEWWDFRMPREIYDRYAPLSDATLPPDMRMTY